MWWGLSLGERGCRGLRLPGRRVWRNRINVMHVGPTGSRDNNDQRSSGDTDEDDDEDGNPRVISADREKYDIQSCHRRRLRRHRRSGDNRLETWVTPRAMWPVVSRSKSTPRHCRYTT